MSRWCDRIITGGILFLVLFTPFAFGSVHPWAFSTMEALIFLLVAVWMAKILCVSKEQRAAFEQQGARSTGQGTVRFAPSTSHHAPHASRRTPYAAPLTLFLVFCLFQLLPLPPSILGILSPQTYEVYTRSLPGWPERMPWSDPSLNNLTPENTAPAILPTAEDVRNGATVPFSGTTQSSLPLGAPSFLLPALGALLPETWFSLSVAPSLTRTDLLKLTAYSALFFLVLLYPFGNQRAALSSQQSARVPRSSILNLRSWIFKRRSSFFSTQSSSLSPHHSSALRADERFFRSVLLVVLFAGLLVAGMGFAQRFSWNGKILWFFVPYDWGAPMAGGTPRSSGPFVNPDHFANYLSLIFPLALAGAMFRTSIMRKPLEEGFRVFCVLAAFIVFTGILLSLSRSGWISALLGVGVLLWFSPWDVEKEMPASAAKGRSEVKDPAIGASQKKGRVFTVRVSLMIVCFLLVLSLLFVGPAGREQVDVRLGETVTQDVGLWGRASVWKDSLGMIRDFPIFGIGLGSWPELFPRYRRAPWSPDFYREAHNDYIELAIETGFIGLVLLSWFFLRAGKSLIRGVKKASREVLPLMAAILAAVGVMTFHELLDFNLQIPANAFLFTLLIALGLRMTASGEHEAISHQRSGFRPAMLGVVALVLAVVSLRQEQIPYPYNLNEPHSIAEAKELVHSHPANAFSQISLLRLWENTAPLSWQSSVLEAALWVEPTNPYIRDLYASTLLRSGKTAEGLREISRSVLDSPSLSSHFYLSGKLILWLSTQEQQAVEEGFKQALARTYPGALNSLAGFYAGLSRFADQAALYEKAALQENDIAKKADALVKAGLAYAKARDESNAERLWRSAITAQANDPRPYQHLATAVYGPNKNLGKAKEIISDGIQNGASPMLLYLSLAEAAEKAGSAADGEVALSSARVEVEKSARMGEDPYALYLLLADAASRIRNRDEEKNALLAALNLKPRSSTTLLRLGNLYFQEQNFDRAALYYSQITNINPNSADAFYQLGVAEEGRYHFPAADKAYARALELAPDNKNFQSRYEGFKQKVAQNRKSEQP